MIKYERKFLDFVSKNAIIAAYIAVTVTACIFRKALFDFESVDYRDYLHPWLEQLRDNGGVSALKEEIGEYNVPYMFFLSLISETKVIWVHAIKIISVFFDFVGAIAAAAIITNIRKTPFFSATGLAGYSLFLLSPTVFINSAWWAQCDSIYSAFILLCIYFMIKDKYAAAMILYSIAFSFKLQALFFLPVIITFYFASRKMSMVNFLLMPVGYFLMILPALIAGRSLKSIIMIYSNQTNLYQQLTCNCPNIYCFFSGDFEAFKKMGVYLTISIIGVGAAIYIKKHKSVSKKSLIILSVWMTYVCVYFLPAMHDRYSYVPCVISVIWAMIYRKDWYIALIINFTTIMSYFGCLIDNSFFEHKLMSVFNLVALIIITKRLFLSNDYDTGEEENEEKSPQQNKKKKSLLRFLKSSNT